VFVFLGVVSLISNNFLTDRQTAYLSSNDVLGESTTGFNIPETGYDITLISSKSYADNDSPQGSRISLSIEIRNQSSNDLQFSPGLNTHLVDSTGRYYNYTADYNDPNHVVGGTIKSNDSEIYILDYDVPLRTEIVSLEFQVDAQASAYKVHL
jgi:hypothetical protein